MLVETIKCLYVTLGFERLCPNSKTVLSLVYTSSRLFDELLTKKNPKTIKPHIPLNIVTLNTVK